MRSQQIQRIDQAVNIESIKHHSGWTVKYDVTVEQEGEEEQEPWTEDDILRLCDRLVEESIKQLFNSRTSQATLREVYSWLSDVKDPNPFSFINCCQKIGYDADELRDDVMNRFKELGRRRAH